VSHVSLAITGDQRHRYALNADRCVAVPGGPKCVVQSLVDLRIARDQPPQDRAQNVARREKIAPAGVRVDDACCPIHQKDSGADSIEHVRKCRPPSP
jgi:hypothetical protein